MKLTLLTVITYLLLLTRCTLSEGDSGRPIKRYRLRDVAHRILSRFSPSARNYIEVLLDAAPFRDNCTRLDEELLTSYGPVQVQSDGCPYVILALRGYFYKPCENLTFMMLPKKKSYEFTSYNIEFIDSKGNSTGEMIEGDTICDDGKYIGRHLYAGNTDSNTETLHSVVFVWRSPKKDVGEIKMRYSVGKKDPSGSHKLWKDCGSLISKNPFNLKYVESIPPPIREVPVGREGGKTPAPPSVRGRGTVERTGVSAGAKREFGEKMYDLQPIGDLGSCQRSGILYTVVPDTKCNRYHVSPGNAELRCASRLVFDVSECVCSYPRYGQRCHV